MRITDSDVWADADCPLKYWTLCEAIGKAYAYPEIGDANFTGV